MQFSITSLQAVKPDLLGLMSSIDMEVIRTVFNFIFFHEKNSKHLKHKQKASN